MKKLLRPLKLSEEDQDKNKILFFKTNDKYNIFTDELADFLDEDIFTAPASTSYDLHNCFKGGLLDHLIRVATYANKLNKILPDNLKQDDAIVTKVSFLSEIGKSKLYKENESEWHVKNLGKAYEYNNDLTAMSIGERSVYYAITNGVTLTDVEYQAIIAHDADDTNEMYKWHSDILTNILKTAIKFAIIEEKQKWEKLQ